MPSRSFIVLPDDSATPILDAINHSSKSLRVKMFTFSDPSLMQAVIAAHTRGVKVRIMLNPARRSGEEVNEATRKMLTHAGVQVLDTNPAFDVTHEKSMVVDDSTAFIQSLNWETKNLTETRDYAVVTSHRHEHLVRANQRGVKIHVLARPLHKLSKAKLVEAVGGLRTLNDVGIKIHRLKHLKLHAKLVFADNQRAIIGSINLAPGSFDSRRELAIEVHDDSIAKRLHDVVHHDWNNSRPLDLSDDGLLAELEESDPTAAEDLALGTDTRKS